MDRLEEEPGRWGGPGRYVQGWLAAAFEQLLEILDRDLPLAQFHQHSHEAPNHSPKKMRGLDAEQKHLIVRVDLGGLDHHNSRFVRARGVAGPEADEVVTAHEHASGARHHGGIESVLDPPDIFLRESGFSRGDLVQIGPGQRIMPRVKAVGGAADVEDGDRGGQTIVQRAKDLAGMLRDLLLHAQMRGLRQGMHARIGTAGAVEFHIGSEIVLRGSTQLPCYGAGVALLLPAAEPRAVVFESELPGQWDTQLTANSDQLSAFSNSVFQGRQGAFPGTAITSYLG